MYPYTRTPITAAMALLSVTATVTTVLGSPATVNESIHELLEDPEDIYNQPAPTVFSVHDDWKDWNTWEASPDIVQDFAYFQMGYDLDGLAVFSIDFGKWDYRKLAHHPDEKIEEFWKYFEQLVRRQQKGAELNNGQGMVEIVDWDGFELSHHASPKDVELWLKEEKICVIKRYGGEIFKKFHCSGRNPQKRGLMNACAIVAIKMAMRLFAGKQRVNNFLNYGYFVNVNFAAETFINTARPFLSNYLDKFEMYGNHVDKWKPRLLKNIAADQLAPKYGGSNADWKPVPFNR